MCILAACIVFTCCGYCFNEVLIPGNDQFSEQQLLEYEAPYKKFKEVGLFIKDKTLIYSISQECILSEEIEVFKTESKKSWLEILINLSEDHWIAINNRSLDYAEKISSVMLNILLGKHGIKKQKLSKTANENFLELKFRCVEQWEMQHMAEKPIDHLTLSTNLIGTELFCQNSNEIMCMYEVAKFLTNTPILYQTVSYDIAREKNLDSKIISPFLESKMQDISSFANLILFSIITKYADQKNLIEQIFETKKRVFSNYLEHLYKIMSVEKMSSYKTIDRGQRSGSHFNTCLFNSVFHEDVSSKNISSTKLASLEKTKAYINAIESAHRIYKANENYEEILYVNAINKNIDILIKDPYSEAIYSYSADIMKDFIFPGLLSECSVLEMQCHSLMMNLSIFPKNKTRQVGESLLSFYGTGYYGSENLAMCGVSCSAYHAQSLVKIL